MSMISAPSAGLSRAQGGVNSPPTSPSDRPFSPEGLISSSHLGLPLANSQVQYLQPTQVSLSSSNHSHSTLSTHISGYFGSASPPMASHLQKEINPIHSSRQQPADDTCRRCGYGGGDIAVKHCGCVLHTVSS
jgi:hypothetical protein